MPVAAGNRGTGAIAGLVPAAVVLGWYIGTGGPPQPALIWMLVATVAAGWIVGPRARGPMTADLLAMVGYFLVAYFLHTLSDTLIWIWEYVRSGLEGDPIAFAEAAAGRWLVRLAYLPVWAVFLSPAALAWMLSVRVLRGRLPPSPDRSRPA